VSTVNSPVPSTRRQRRAEQRRRGAGSTGRPSETRPVAGPPAIWRSPLVLVTGLAVVAMVVVIAALALTSGREPTGGNLGLIAPPESNVDEYASGAALGEPDAPVVLEVYSDYQCPWCGKFARETLPGLVREFVAAGDLRIEEHAIAFLGTTSPDESLDAAVAVGCAIPAGKYWAFHDYLAWNQDGENEGAFRRERLFGIADRIGLDEGTLASCLDDPVAQAAVQTRTEDAFAAGINSTPTFVLDGEKIEGLSSFDALVPMIQAKVDAIARP